MTRQKTTKPRPIEAACDTTYHAVHDSGVRPAAKIRNVCVHSTEGATAVSAAMWFTNPSSGGSAHLVVDDHVCYRTLEDLRIPWAAPGLNEQGYHIEFAGFARWTRADWLKHDLELRRGAYKAAIRCNLYKIPARWVGPVGLRLRRRGLTTHRDVTRAWPRLGSHTDPGPGFPKALFLEYVRHYIAELAA